MWTFPSQLLGRMQFQLYHSNQNISLINRNFFFMFILCQNIDLSSEQPCNQLDKVTPSG